MIEKPQNDGERCYNEGYADAMIEVDKVLVVCLEIINDAWLDNNTKLDAIRNRINVLRKQREGSE